MDPPTAWSMQESEKNKITMQAYVDKNGPLLKKPIYI